MIDGILHRVRVGVRWRDLPERFGPWKTVYERHRLWSADGTWERLLQQVQAAADAAGEIDWDVSVDSTTVRAHQRPTGSATVTIRAARTASNRTTSWRFSSGTAPHCGIWGAQQPHARPLTLTTLSVISQSLTQLPDQSSGAEQAINPYDRAVPRPRAHLCRHYGLLLERAINRLKQHRAVATRYDKRRYVYLGTATAAALTIWLRT